MEFTSRLQKFHQEVRKKLPWFSEWYWMVRKPVEIVARTAVEIRVTLVVSAFLALIFHAPQAIEAFAVLGEEIHSNFRGPLAFGLALVLVWAGFWFSARVVLSLALPDAYGKNGVEGAAVRNLPRFAALLPVASVSWAIWKASQSAHASVELLVIAMVVAVFCILSVGFYVWIWDRRRRHASVDHRQLFIERLVKSAPGMSRVVFGLGIAFFVFSIWETQLATHIGPLVVCCLAAFFWNGIGSILTWQGHGIRFPLVNAVILMVLIFSYLDLNDNHTIRDLAPSDPKSESATPLPLHGSLDKTLRDWLANRPDRSRFSVNDPYPIVLVSAQGGGIYAAHFTAMVLAEMQDTSPEFMHHVFAISGVSGGTVGAGFFCALAREASDHAGTGLVDFPGDTRKVLRRDFLAPVIASGLFSDLLQQGLFFPIDSWDRAIALEDGLERAWSNHHTTRHFSNDFRELNNRFALSSVPILLCNTTQAETGRRIVISSLPLSGWSIAGGAFLHDIAPTLTLRASTAMSVSSRFPFVTPAASLVVGSGNNRQKIRLVDGGYFDNSGTATIRDLVRGIEKTGIKGIRIIVLTIGTSEQELGRIDGRHESGYEFGEILSPVRTVLAARQARSENARAMLVDELSGRADVEVIPVSLNVRGPALPLGWLLSQRARNEIELQIKEQLARQKRLKLSGSPTEVLVKIKPAADPVRNVLDPVKKAQDEVKKKLRKLRP